ncbi:MAG: hypothetical protein GY746_07490 [Gammaproteobacteria bacterium]|nr:hypothetical protein [Gammaproteobacteria bacterium]
MKNDTKLDKCICSPHGKYAVLEKDLDENYNPIWTCRNCGNTKKRQIRVSAKQKAMDEFIANNWNEEIGCR